MIKFINLTDEYTFKWELQQEHDCTRFSYSGSEHYKNKVTHYIETKLKGTEFIEWLQIYGLMPNEMFKGTNPFRKLYFGEYDELKSIDAYELYKAADEWKDTHKEVIEKNPWTVVAMNGGFALLSNGSKDNTVELGSASIMNLEMDNSNNTTIKNNPNINVRAQASLF